tara:strand:- start:288 stop:515 length:228 start_codon:yes stop_codon:yes gene_type:complete
MQNRRQRYGLSKYDAPLRIQYQKGYDSFRRGKVTSPFHPNSMQHREWARGFNDAFARNLKKVKQYEYRGRSQKVS